MNYFVVELSMAYVVLYVAPAIDSYAGVACCLDAKDLVLIRLKLQHHGDMIEVRATIGARDYRCQHVASEQQDVTCLGLCLELVLRNVVKAPRLGDSCGSQLVLVAGACLLMLDDCPQPLGLGLFAISLELELSRLPF